MADPTLVLAILAVSAFVPPLVFLSWVRRTEKYGQEPWGRVLRTFFFGAIFAVILGVILSLVLLAVFQRIDRVYVFSGRNPNIETIVLALLIAPFAEEFAKGVGVYLARPLIDEPEDGIVYGAASGFGFAATENLLYGLAALVGGGTIQQSILLVGLRSISSALLHGSSTATFGYGIGVSRLWPSHFRVFPYYLAAVAMHASFNFVASLGDLSQQRVGDSIVLVGAIVIAFVAFAAIRAKIAKEDARRHQW